MKGWLIVGLLAASLDQSVPKQADQPTWYEEIFEPVRANWPLVAVAIWGIVVARSTLLAIRWQAEETAKATKSMRDSINLQEAQMKQWVELGNWRGGNTVSRDQDGSAFLMFEFDIFNPTAHGITLGGIKWDISGQEDHIEINAPLPPIRAHPTTLSYDLTVDQVTSYINQTPLKLTVRATVDFTDTLGKKRDPTFVVSFHCRYGSGILTIKHFETAAWTSPKGRVART
jgi:hypothetical protein